MPELDLDELERLAKAATPGPWEQGDGVFDPSLIRTSYKVGSNIIGDLIHHKALRRDTKGRFYVIEVCGEQWRDNAAYIVAACNALPGLIKRVREMDQQMVWLAKQVCDSISPQEWINRAEQATKEAGE